MATLRILDIIRGTAVDGPGLRTSIYFAGCAHACKGCHNPSSWDFGSGTPMTVDQIMEVVREEGWDVTLSGGDPVYQASGAAMLAERLREEGYGVWLYTGFVAEDLLGLMDPDVTRLLQSVDVVVDGPFVEELRDISLKFRGSSNQRILRTREWLADQSASSGV